MPLRIIKREDSPYWQITGSLNGVRVRQSTGTDSRAEAEKYRLNIEAKILGGKPLARKSVAHAIVAYIENGGDNRFLKKVTLTLGHEFLEDLNQEVIDRAARQAYPGYKRGPAGPVTPHKKSTIRRQFYVPLAAVLHYASDAGWMPYMRLKMPAGDRPPPVWAELDWFESLWPHCAPHLKALTTFLPFTGCRISECLRLTWEDVNLGEGWAFIRDTKNKEHRTVYLPEVVALALKEIQADTGRVFKYKDKDQVKNRLKTACKKAGIPYLSSHKIGSHTYATLMRRYAGTDARGLVATGRWKDVKSTYHYMHASVSDESRKVDILTQRLTQKTDKITISEG